MGSLNPIRRLPDPVIREVAAVDSFVRAYPPPAPDASLPDETDLLQGRDA